MFVYGNISLISSYNEKMLQTNVAVKIKTYIVCSIIFASPKNRAVHEIMWKNDVAP